MATKEQSVAECAVQLRQLGDLIYWKYILLELLELLTRTLPAASGDPVQGT